VNEFLVWQTGIFYVPQTSFPGVPWHMLVSMTGIKNYSIDAPNFLLIDGCFGQHAKINLLFITPGGVMEN
jgi:hypothetical protein